MDATKAFDIVFLNGLFSKLLHREALPISGGGSGGRGAKEGEGICPGRNCAECGI